VATSLASWRTLALLLALINLKSLPFIWHVSTSHLSRGLLVDFLTTIPRGM
jgi:hypothetical protein